MTKRKGRIEPCIAKLYIQIRNTENSRKTLFFHMFYNVTQYHNSLGTYFGQILNQQVLAHTMIPNLVNLVEGNSSLLGGFPT